MKKYLLITLVIILNQPTFSQNEFTFVFCSNFLENNLDTLYISNLNVNKVKYEIIDSNHFKVIGIFTSFKKNTECTNFEYYVDSKKNWWIIENSKKHIFFDSKNKKINNFNSNYCNRNVYYIKKKKINNFLVYCIEFSLPNVNSSEKLYYWFTENDGVIAYSRYSSGMCYIREDFIEKIVTSDKKIIRKL